MAQLGLKLKAATLIESLIAMVIIVVCMGVGIMIYSNVLDSDKQRMRLKSYLLLDKESEKTKVKKSYLDDEMRSGDYTVKKILTKIPETENLYELALTVLNQEGNIIGKRKELIISE
ncbi:MAG: hypothetical protein H0X46_04580 [Bacteroidetes bacterium]|nr:hypothetical protein [Bacteroidota bacterium]